ncbi:bifunctional (p)ppGpp synthetase/guanosine-3',5'-bis(diphosphate) 3'-pyrophosphohydrolase, partial [Amycolatopsis sp. H6(2020)]|nr:bifunctional (p)ppGpp synthetase/guanosine-3',5'-bis(diphosphate) 3'-pyrophosphohydrolase [Amycolatopsis sp. H6(2020)]
MSASARTPVRRSFPTLKKLEPGAGTLTSQLPAISPVLVPLLRTVMQHNPQEDIGRIEKAFKVADRCHTGQKRKSGDPYITHPVAVTTILAELGASGATLIAGLLHDTVEDTDYTLEQLTEDFGAEVAELVDGVLSL